MSTLAPALLLLSVSSGLAGEVVIDARVPVEITIDGHLRAKLYTTGVVHLEVDTGKHPVTLFVNGKPETIDIDVPLAGSTSILVGRTGISTTPGISTAPAGPVVEGTPSAPTAVAPSTVQFHAVGKEQVLLQIDNSRHRIDPGQSVAIVLASGNHKMSLRDSAGTTIWARGTLEVSAGELVVQLVEGRLPETAGEGGSFRPDGG